MKKIPVSILGANGLVGQQLLSLLEDHPFFEVKELVASPKREGQCYAEVVNWSLPKALPPSLASLRLSKPEPHSQPLVFSALPAAIATELEPKYVEAGAWVLSNASSFRKDPKVPIIVPEINASQSLNSKLITGPNCVAAPLSLCLEPLQKFFGVEAVLINTYQSLSGAGLAAPRERAAANVIPYIEGEEEKIAFETNKILGTEFTLSASCARVPVEVGHLASVSVKLKKEAHKEEIKEAWKNFKPSLALEGLPSLPDPIITYCDAEDEPQPKYQLGQGIKAAMSVQVGRLRPCPVLGWKFILLGHNLLRGAAGNLLLTAEYLVKNQSIK